jgi:transposase-like protein
MTTNSTNGTASAEVSERATRRRFTAGYKVDILERYGKLPAGERGAFLRQEGLYSSHLDAWRKQRDAGVLDALTPKKRGPKAKVASPLARENAELRRALAKAERKLKRAEMIIEVQKKVAQALKELDEETPENDGSDS